MKKFSTKLLSLTALLIFLGCVQLSAQNAKLTPEQRQAKRVEAFAQKLGLNADQKAQVITINQAQEQKMQAAQKKQYASQEACNTAMHSLRMERKNAIEQVLTPQQKTKWEQMRQPANKKPAAGRK